MDNAGRAYVLSATIALAAMVDRAGWIAWPALGRIAAIGLTAILCVGLVLALIVVIVGIPTVILTAATVGLLKLMPKQRGAEPPT